MTLSDCTRDTTTTGAGGAGIGLITKTFNNGVALTTDFDWFDLITSSAVSEVLGGLNASESGRRVRPRRPPSTALPAISTTSLTISPSRGVVSRYISRAPTMLLPAPKPGG